MQGSQEHAVYPDEVRAAEGGVVRDRRGALFLNITERAEGHEPVGDDHEHQCLGDIEGIQERHVRQGRRIAVAREIGIVE